MRANLGILIKSVVATILYIVLMELSALWVLIPEKLAIDGYDKFYILIQGTVQLMLVGTFIFFINRQIPQQVFKNTSNKWYLIAAVLGSLFVVMQSPLKWIYNLFFGTDYMIVYDFDGLSTFSINMLATVLFIPIAEELFFRGYIQENLQKQTKTWIAIGTASILFALIHSPYLNLIFSENNQNWHLAYLTFFGGLISGLIYYKSKSIGPSMIFHMCWNLMVFIV